MLPAARGDMTGCARGARPRGVTHASFSKFAEFFWADGTVTRPGGGSDLILAPGTWYLVRGTERGDGKKRERAVGSLPSARCQPWPVRAAPLRNSQCGSISSVSSRRDPGAPRLQNPHPPLRFRFAQPRSTQYFVLGTQILASLGFLIVHSSLRSECSEHSARCARMQLGACGASHQVPSTEF